MLKVTYILLVETANPTQKAKTDCLQRSFLFDTCKQQHQQPVVIERVTQQTPLLKKKNKSSE